ncbi:MAG: AlpA family phage regulatory protein [Hyphomicrobiaceae bacterium]
MRLIAPHPDYADELGPDADRQALLRSAEELIKLIRKLVDDERRSADGSIQLAGSVMEANPVAAMALAATANSISRLSTEIAGELMLRAQREYVAELAVRARLNHMSAEEHEELRQDSAEQGIGYTPPYAATQYLNQWPDDAMITTAQIVDFTSLSQSTIERMIERGSFPVGVKLGERRVAWRWGDVRQIMFKLADHARERARRIRQTRQA